MSKCSLKCPSGSDDECPSLQDGTELKCLSGVSDCKNEMGLGVYDNSTANDSTPPLEGDVMVPEVVVNVDNVEVEETSSPTTAKPSKSPTKLPTPGETFYSLGGDDDSESTKTDTTAAKPTGMSKPQTEDEATSTTNTGVAETTTSAVTDDSTEQESPNLPELQGPFDEDMVRIILYGLDSTSLLSSSQTALEQWKTLTTTYFTNFFNKYPTQEMLAEGIRGPDTIRNSVTDVSIEIMNEVMEEAPVHEFNPMVVRSVNVREGDRKKKRNLRTTTNNNKAEERRTQQEGGIDLTKVIMITYSQTTTYRSSLVVINDDPNLIVRRPLETPEYRAEYVSYLRSANFDIFGDLEYVSRFLYTEFPTMAPSGTPTEEPSASPVLPGEPSSAPQTDAPITSSPTDLPPTMHPTENFGCNLCKPGQYGVNADVIFNGEVSSCMEIYNWFLKNWRQGSGGCREAQDALSDVCCRDGVPVTMPTNEPIVSVNVDPPPPAPQPVVPPPTSRPIETLEIPVDENGLPDALSLSETYYCGVNWDSVSSNCDTATPCPLGDSSVCPESEQCIAFTNCGGKFSFVSDPSVDGGGPNVDEVKSTFYCGSSMQFLEMKCEGATPCPNGPKDCTVEGEEFGCFAFTGCNDQVDPGKFVGFLRPPDEEEEDALSPGVSATMFCATTWAELDSQCVDGIPQGATPCPSGDILECGEGEGCFAFACNNGVELIPPPAPSPSANKPTGDYSVEDMDLLKSTFFCGTSVEEIDGDCENALPCPSGDECPEGYGCFAFSQCGGVDINSLVDTFGKTDRPTRAPSVPIEQVCDEESKMSINVGYWQSWSI